jgi:hypothetical protein
LRGMFLLPTVQSDLKFLGNLADWWRPLKLAS